MNSITKYLSPVLVVLAALALPALAQDAASPAAAAAPDQTVVAPAPIQDELSIYGEVQAVDTAAQTITVQYYDYDADEEKTISIVCDTLTKFENAASAADVKKGDWADITYSVKDGKNMAKSIIVEKEEEVTTPQAPTVETPDVQKPGIDQE